MMKLNNELKNMITNVYNYELFRDEIKNICPNVKIYINKKYQCIKIINNNIIFVMLATITDNSIQINYIF